MSLNTLTSVGTSEPERLKLSSVEIERVPSFKLHDVWQQENLRWNHHINETVKKTNKRLHYLRACRVVQLPPGVGTNLANEFQRVQNRSLDIIGVPMDTLPALEQRRREAAKAEQERILAD